VVFSGNQRNAQVVEEMLGPALTVHLGLEMVHRRSEIQDGVTALPAHRSPLLRSWEPNANASLEGCAATDRGKEVIRSDK